MVKADNILVKDLRIQSELCDWVIQSFLSHCFHSLDFAK